ncbi:MAG: dinitrogenase iron-molybdenum cofactor biosynthesis protein [Clostridiales bacterium]|nr:dinitrogenase iron-molybdenum cofactor biosynthesis protein [Clostridiales bacterium]
MSENCNHNCSSCGESCDERTAAQMDFRAQLNEMSHVKNVIAVVSGKGGVGKTMVTSMLSVLMNREGYKTAVLDADITGPSIPKAFGLKERAMGDKKYIYPVKTKSGISVMSLNLLLENETDPVVWRGPIIADMVKQFWTDVVWDEIDYMFIDMPPGTGDIPLTVYQSLPIDGIVVVASPQELVGMVVEKAINMANMMKIPVLGLVENMSYFECPDCGGRHSIFGESHIDEIAEKYGIDTVCKLPINPKLASATDAGLIELMEEERLYDIVEVLEDMGKDFLRIAVTYDNGEVFQHFGHTQQFKLYDIENGELTDTYIVDTNGSGHGALAEFLITYQVDALICGGIGGGAREALGSVGIEIFSGASGDADAAVIALLQNALEYDPDYVCDHHGEGHSHEDGHSCGSHGCGGGSCGHH